MGSSEIEGTAGISHPLPPFLNNRSQRSTTMKPETMNLHCRMHYVNRSYWNGVRIAYEAPCYHGSCLIACGLLDLTCRLGARGAELLLIT